MSCHSPSLARRKISKWAELERGRSLSLSPFSRWIVKTLDHSLHLTWPSLFPLPIIPSIYCFNCCPLIICTHTISRVFHSIYRILTVFLFQLRPSQSIMSTDEKVEMEAVPLKTDTDETKTETTTETVIDKKEAPKKTWFFKSDKKKVVTEEDVEEGKEKTKKKCFWRCQKEKKETGDEEEQKQVSYQYIQITVPPFLPYRILIVLIAGDDDWHRHADERREADQQSRQYSIRWRLRWGTVSLDYCTLPYSSYRILPYSLLPYPYLPYFSPRPSTQSIASGVLTIASSNLLALSSTKSSEFSLFPLSS